MQLIILVLLSSIVGLSQGTLNHRLDLRSQLLNSSVYDPMVRPRLNSSDAVEVKFKLQVISVMEYSEIESKLSLGIRLMLNWYDEFLRWNATSYNGESSVIVKGKEIWAPNDLRILNTFDSGFLKDGFNDIPMRVDYNGYVSTERLGVMSIMCSYIPDKFPFDCQSCSALFNMRLYKTNEAYAVLHDNGIEILEGAKNGNAMWELIDITSATIPSYDSTIIVAINFKLKRKPLFYTLNLIIPNTILSALVLMSYYIPIEQGEKISFGITIFLTYIVFMTQISDIIPKTSDSSTAIGNYFILLMVSSALGITNSVVLSYLQYGSEASTKVVPEELVLHKGHHFKHNKVVTVFRHLRTISGKRLLEFVFVVISLVLIMTANGILLHTYLTPDCY